MIHTFYYVIQQPFFNVQPSWIFNKLKVLEWLERSREERGQNGRRVTKVYKSVRETNCGIQWIVIYLVDSVAHLLNNWAWRRYKTNFIIKICNFLNLKNSAQFLHVFMSFIHMSILANLSNRQQENSFIADNKVLNHETEPWLFEITCFNSLKRLQKAWHWPFKLNWAMKTSKRVVVVKNKQCFLL